MPRVPIRFQQAGNDCGPVCLQIVAAHFQREIPLQTLMDVCRPGRTGSSIAQLAEAAESLNMRTAIVRMTFDHLRRVALPCIAHIRGNHYVVIERVTRRSVRFVDPNSGRRVVDAATFMDDWATTEGGVLLLIEPSQQFERNRGGLFGRLSHYVRYFREYRLQLLLVAFSIAAGAGLQLFIAFVTRALVDVGIAARSMPFVYVILASQLAMFGARTLNDFLRSRVMLEIGARTNLAIIADFLKALTKVPTSYFDRKTVGDLLQRIGDHARVQSFLTSNTAMAVSASGNVIIFGIALALLSARISAIFFAAAAALTLWLLAFAKARRQLDEQRFRQSSETQSALVQMFAGMRDIRLATCERNKRAEWEWLQAKQFRLSINGMALSQQMQGGAMAINELKNIVISVVSAASVIHGDMTLGTMLAISYMVGTLNAPIEQLAGLFQAAQDAKISADRIAEVHEEARQEEAGIAVPESLDIAIRGVSFRYAGAEHEVLRNVSLDIPQGSRLAIVGASGSGKTTLIKLLAKLYAPTDGDITAGGASLSELDTAGWRRRCGIVLQDGFLFSDSFAGNVALGSDSIELERLRHVCELARLDALLKRMPDGVDTRIGPNGHELSAGERQRVLIARALYRQPDIFIFDEATSALDGVTERELLNNLDVALAGKTVITVAHRLGTVINADRIVVLEDGVLAENGTHHDLVSSRRTYYRLIKNQLELGA